MKKSNYQKHYENQVGTAVLDTKEVIAGEKTNCSLTYTVGELGLDDSGSVKVLFRLASDVAEPQFSNKEQDNFVYVYSSNKKAQVEIDSRSEGTKGKMGIRPWSRGFRIVFSGTDLQKEDRVYIQFKNWRMQTFCEETFEYKILIDPFATNKYIELPQSPKMRITHGEPQKLVIIAPSKTTKGEVCSALVKLEDRWGNPCSSLGGEFKIFNSDEVGCVSKIKFRNGKALLKIKPELEEGNGNSISFVKAQYGSLRSSSNPIVLRHSGDQKNFWAELHGQSEETVGTNSIDSYFDFAKNYAHVDVLGHQGNDFQITNDFWKKINKVSSEYNKEGSFVSFPGYEWSGNTSKGGDRNVYYLEEGQKIYRSSHALIDDYDDVKDDVFTAKELFRKFKNNKRVLVVSHVGGRRADLSVHESSVERLIEVHSCWGTFEWFLFEALRNNYVVGVTAGSDGHDGRPGASYPGLSHFANKGGLTCVLAKTLDRENIFTALQNRHCYATTGARIILDIFLKEGGKTLGTMGDVVSLRKSVTPKLAIATVGTSLIERIELYNKDKILKTFFPFDVENDTATKYVKIAWKGAQGKGRDRGKHWKGNIRFQGCAVSSKKIETINFLNSINNKYSVVSETNVEWEGQTSGNMQALILPIRKIGMKKSILTLKVNEKTINISFDEIKKKPKKYKFEGTDSFVEVYQTSSTTIPTHITLEEEIEKLNKGLNSVFVKVIQRDGHSAWSSPIFIKAK